MFSRWIVTNITSASVTTFLAFLAGIIYRSVYCTTLRTHVQPLLVLWHNYFSLFENLSLIYHAAVSIVMFPFKLLRYCNKSIVMPQDCYVTVEMLQTHCYATRTVTLLWKYNKLIVMPQELLRYYGYTTNSLLCNRNCYVTMEIQQTHCYATGTLTLLWKCNRVHRSCHQGNLICNNMLDQLLVFSWL
jgi:hypothetical protein